jgi:cation diffusion facilitator CzcD-associated flavoprotein CzcO
MERVSLLVIGAGPYGLAVAAHAQEHGIKTVVVGRPMTFWTEHMPDGMFLRSGPDWHLDAANVHTFEAFLEERGIAPADIDPVPISVFLDYAKWFRDEKRVGVRECLVSTLVHDGQHFQAQLDDGTTITADRVVATPGVRHFQQLPEWADQIAPALGAHTCELTRFEDLRGARVLIVGGRQSAYEWAALAGEHGAERIDIVHRHDTPRFARVSWRFVDPYIDQTLTTRGWWRSLPSSDQQRISRQFWEVGRLTLEWWLTPRLADARFHRWPNAHVTTVAQNANTIEVGLSNGERLGVDRIVYATGYAANLPRIPYLHDVLPDIELTDGFPNLDTAFQTSIPGLYIPGFAATRDFGPFFGFTKGCPAAATLIVQDLLRTGQIDPP